MGYACIESFGCDECNECPRARIIAICNKYPVYQLSLCMACAMNIKQEFQTMVDMFLCRQYPFKATFSGLGLVREKNYDGTMPFWRWIKTEIANHG